MKERKKCETCGGMREEKYKFCPYCGSKFELTRSDYIIAKHRAKDAFLVNCTRGVPQDIGRLLGCACWDFAEWKFEERDKYDKTEPTDVIPDSVFDALVTVHAKAEELFGLILEF